MAGELLKIIHAMVRDCRVPTKVLAQQIGKPYSTLLREVNPNDGGAKLGVETFIQLLKATGDTGPIEYIARELDLEVVPKKLPEREYGRPQ